MTCEYTDCTDAATTDCADCWPWQSLCDAHIFAHEHQAEDLEVEVQAQRERDAEYSDSFADHIHAYA